MVAPGSVLPITISTLQFGCKALVVHHLRPLRTYSSPSRSIRSSMFVASDDATAGSVIPNAERISPASSGFSQRSWFSGVAKCENTSMLPVSGAEQLHASERDAAAPEDLRQRRVLGVLEARSPLGVGVEQVPEAAVLGLDLQCPP